MPLPALPAGVPGLSALGAAAEQGGRVEGSGAGGTEQLGRYKVGRHVAGALRRAAEATGVDFEVLAAKAAMESGFRPAAQAGTSSARGLFQFIDQTWLSVVKEHGAEHGLAAEAAAITEGSGGRLSISDPAQRRHILALRDDPDISARLGAEHLKDIGSALTPILGRKPDVTELYLGHFLGLGGAREILRQRAADPAVAASEVLPEAARANPRVFRAEDGQPLSTGQFIDRLRQRLQKTYADLGLEAPSGPVAMAPLVAAAKAGETPAGGTATPAKASAEPNWWGSGPPMRVRQMPEQAMMSTLVEVFTRMGQSAAQRDPQRGGEARGAAGGTAEALPALVLRALRESPAADAQAASRAYGGTG